jgi:hypothetical protein
MVSVFELRVSGKRAGSRGLKLETGNLKLSSMKLALVAHLHF